MNLKKTLVGAALAIVSFAAAATVVLNKNADGYYDGTGWVGKGDVQIAYGWNNKTLQTNEKNISFALLVTDKKQGVCEWTTAEGKKGQKTHDVTHKRSTNISWAVDTLNRNNSSGKDGSNTGYFLKGFTNGLDTGDIDGDAGLFAKYPLVQGGACPGNAGTDGVWIAVIANETTGGLYVFNNGADPRLLLDLYAPPPVL